MSKINPEPNLIHIMGCYVLGNPNGEKVRVLRFWVWIPGLLAELGSVLTHLCFVFLFVSGRTAVPEAEEPDEALFCGV